MRESILKDFIIVDNSKLFLNNDFSNVQIVSINGKNINFGKRIAIESGDTIILFVSQKNEIFVSITKVNNNDFHEIYSCYTTIYRVDKLLLTIPRPYLRFIALNIRKATENYTNSLLY